MKAFRLRVWDVAICAFLIVLAWGTSVQVFLLAAIAFLLYLILRVYVSSRATIVSLQPASELTEAASTKVAEAVPDEFELLLDKDEDGHRSIELDVDLRFRPCKNRFRFSSQIDTCVRASEHEYRMEGTDVFERLLQSWVEDIGRPKLWEVRDGVVQETDIRAEHEKQSELSKRLSRLEESISEWKARAEWKNMGASVIKYVILSRNLPIPDARRHFRQELERLKLGVAAVTREAAKYGFEPDKEGVLRLKEGCPQPSDEDIEKLWTSYGISYFEFHTPDLIAILEDLVGAGVKGGKFEALVKARALKDKEQEEERARKRATEA